MLGTVLAGVFVAESLGGAGLAEGQTMMSQVFTQVIGVVATTVWCGVVTFVLLKLVQAIVGLRVTSEAETEGLDLREHDERGYIL